MRSFARSILPNVPKRVICSSSDSVNRNRVSRLIDSLERTTGVSVNNNAIGILSVGILSLIGNDTVC